MVATGSISPAFVEILSLAMALLYLAIITLTLAVAALEYVSYWFIAKKAGRSGWVGIIPVLNDLMLLDLAGKPWWWVLLFFIPLVGIVLMILTYVDLARAFGKSGAWAVGLICLPYVFLPLLAFSKNIAYNRPADFPPAWLEI